MESKIKYPKESFRIIGICMEVHRILGPGLLEIVYKDALEMEFRMLGIPFEREKEYPVIYKNKVLPHKFYADFVVYDSIILEIKAKKWIADEHLAQTINYITLAKSPLGMIINFGTSSLEYNRVVK
jgi:GxxExxY protein